MKKSRLVFAPLLALPLLFSCGGSGDDKPVFLLMGNAFESAEKIQGNSHLRNADASLVNTLVANKANFILLVKDTSDGCVCWSSFHDEVLAPYILKNKLTAYLISLAEYKLVENYATLGLTTYVSAVSLGIFEGGKVKFQGNTADLSSPWVTDASVFASWMEKRIVAPKVYEVSEAYLSDLYEGNGAFTIYFGRGKCPDCSYFEENTLKNYLSAHERTDPAFYYFDGDLWRDNLDSNAYAAKKEEFGLAYSEDNPAGYGAGAFPTLYRIHPDGTGRKKGDVIELAAVFFNESLDENMVVHDSYFTEARLDLAKASEVDFLEYARASRLDNVLDGKTLSIPGYAEMSRVEKATARKNALAVYEDPLANAFLDMAIGNQA